LNSLRRTRVAGFGLDKSISLTALKAGEFSILGLVDVARTTFSTRELEPNEINELSFGRPLSANPDEAIYAAISGQDLIALLRNKDGLAKPIAVFAAAN
jgi:tRNA pseudouridine55 synthase